VLLAVTLTIKAFTPTDAMQGVLIAKTKTEKYTIDLGL